MSNRLPTMQSVYLALPRPVQRLAANLEAWRRNTMRRYGDYAAVENYYSPEWYSRATLEEQQCFQLERLRALLTEARNVPYYRDRLIGFSMKSLDDLCKLPILEKQDIRKDRDAFVATGLPRRSLWLHATSGSTGSPMHYFHDRSMTRAHQAVADAILRQLGCPFGTRRARISGVYVAPYKQKAPPFWIYIDLHRQLQCSAYHLSLETSAAYLLAMRQARVALGTGYATAWHLLGTYVLESGERPPRLSAIVTDSEGLSVEQQATVERAFECPVRQTYGLGETGQIGMQCSEGRYHELTRNSIIELLDDSDRPVAPGEAGQVVVTDLTAATTPFIRYRTGDLAIRASEVCRCGQHNPSWLELVGRVDDQVLTPDGRWIGRLSHVTKPGVGIRESQIVQQAIDRVLIRVVPDLDFEPGSMEKVLDAAHRYLGDQMQVRWEPVDALTRMHSGKLRHVIREF